MVRIESELLERRPHGWIEGAVGFTGDGNGKLHGAIEQGADLHRAPDDRAQAPQLARRIES
jgi:hypothetical protein